MKTFLLVILGLLWAPVTVHAAIEIDRQDAAFYKFVSAELDAMREGKRGPICAALVERLDLSTATTIIAPVTSDESTWHPNDKKGTRSHVLPMDTKIQGAERREFTGARLFLHPSRIDPRLSLYKLGTFVYCLAIAADLNYGQFSTDYRVRERRAVFFSNAWKDALGYALITVSDNVPTSDYQKAKKDGQLISENKDNFPILAP
jgi:hypothetical protein